MTRMNWTAANDRGRIQRHGAESIDGLRTGQRPPIAKQEQAPKARPKGPTLSAPVKVDSFWANRAHDAIVVTLKTFNGHNLVDVRKHAMNGAGQLVPTPKGVALKITRLPDLAKAINQALAQAKELGLLPPDDGATE
jgi:hypothetical protein